ncbi:SusC/RagA family TonB-linked outer membrane protein [Xylanibacter ruminicola]|uniref:TonB dependent receptor n=2 Tax=Xylanibacter ruminicola TaxID=839 RepID=D5EV48_XYLR2|nr:TonB-dependent receptor [Xylanibacter ruminicola]ADE81337.1 putative TonB dependent receptor [Xylanibacter ruminicola 23]GJG34638.1 SusC/RagA family TonB-linked outer membrane protein [Xylanibacter ruminicola]SEH90272.1 TonB-linked outer membrane protein, SusC/RagA family [Xylanibacter ruminicola]
MNRNFRKTALLMGTMACLGLGYSSNAYAAGAPQEIQQATKKITGTVVDASGPVIGASVVEKGKSGNGVITDFDGNFSLSVSPGATLVISYIGYETQEIKVGNQSTLSITLKEDNAQLDEVVVVGYGTQKKKLVTGATVQVKGEDIAKLNTTNALTAMQSSTPGVQITQSSSQPGKGFKVNIRGVGTIGTSSPLLIIDGINAGTADDGLNGLNPNDIESIDVLKDAASAAIYGARAANGVILVTTKQGKAGKIQVQYDGYVGWSNAYKVPGTVNANQYMQLINETNFNTYGTSTNWSSLVPQQVLDRVNQGWDGTDWFKEYENKNALQFSHAVTLTGGSENSKFSMSLNYSSNQGIMGGADLSSDYKRYGGRINSEHILLKAKDHSVITIGENVSYWYHRSHDLAESNGYWNIMQAAYIASPLVDPYDANGNLASYKNNGAGYSTMIYNNPLNHFLNGGFNSINQNRDFGVGATFYWIIEPIKNLKYRGQFNTGFSASNNRSISLPYSASSTSSSANYGMNMGEYESSSFTLENTLSYALPKLGKHSIDVLVGQSIERSNWSTGMNMSFTVSEENLNSLVRNGWDYNIPANYETQYMTGHGGYANPMQGSIASFFGRVNWNYDEKYMATAIIRADGSSNFARGKRWGYFPSFSAGWVITNENFMESTKGWLDFLKFRASWGQNGNCNISNFYYLSNIAFSPTDYADYGYKFSSDMNNTVDSNIYQTGAYAKNAPNPDVTWETSEQINVGLDARFISGKLGLNFDWYVKKTKDWLLQAPMNEVLGYEESAMINGGDVKNTGFEVALSWRDQVSKDFSYHANVNVATNKNKVTRIANDQGLINGQTKALFENSSYVSRVQEGHAIGYFYGMSYSGIWQNQQQIDDAKAAGKAVLDGAVPGDPIWDDFDNDGVIDYDNDRHEIGNPHPDVTLGVSLGCEWKGFDFGITGSGAFGMQVMQCYRTALLANQYNSYTVDAFDRWHGEGTSNKYPRLTVGQIADQWVSTRYMQNADYFKIQNITLGYNFNKLWKNSPFSQLRLYVQAQNLYTFTGYTGVDPEVGSSGGKDSWARGIDVGLYPSARTFVVGASIKF